MAGDVFTFNTLRGSASGSSRSLATTGAGKSPGSTGAVGHRSIASTPSHGPKRRRADAFGSEDKVRPLARLLLVLAIVSTVACAQTDWIDRTLVTENVTGVWSGSTEGSPVGLQVQLELRQQGAKITGELKVPQPGTYSFGSGVPIEGNVAGDVFTFRDQRGVFSGELTVGGDNMVGRILSQWGAQRASLHRASAGPQSDSATR